MRGWKQGTRGARRPDEAIPEDGISSARDHFRPENDTLHDILRVWRGIPHISDAASGGCWEKASRVLWTRSLDRTLGTEGPVGRALLNRRGDRSLCTADARSVLVCPSMYDTRRLPASSFTFETLVHEPNPCLSALTSAQRRIEASHSEAGRPIPLTAVPLPRESVGEAARFHSSLFPTGVVSTRLDRTVPISARPGTPRPPTICPKKLS